MPYPNPYDPMALLRPPGMPDPMQTLPPPAGYPNWGGTGSPTSGSPPAMPAGMPMPAPRAITDPRDASGYQGPRTPQPGYGTPGPMNPDPRVNAGAAGGIQPGMGNLPPGAATGGAQGGSSFLPYMPIENADRAVFQALQSLGVNASSPNFLVDQVKKRAKEMIATLVLRAQANPSFFADPAAQATAIKDMVGSALQGGSVFAGAGDRNALGGLLQLEKTPTGGAEGSGMNLGLDALKTILEDPSTVANLAAVSRYGGMPASLQAIARAPLEDFGYRVAGLREAGGVPKEDTALNMLLRGVLPLY